MSVNDDNDHHEHEHSEGRPVWRAQSNIDYDPQGHHHHDPHGHDLFGKHNLRQLLLRLLDLVALLLKSIKRIIS